MERNEGSCTKQGLLGFLLTYYAPPRNKGTKPNIQYKPHRESILLGQT